MAILSETKYSERELPVRKNVNSKKYIGKLTVREFDTLDLLIQTGFMGSVDFAQRAGLDDRNAYKILRRMYHADLLDQRFTEASGGLGHKPYHNSYGDFDNTSYCMVEYGVSERGRLAFYDSANIEWGEL